MLEKQEKVPLLWCLFSWEIHTSLINFCLGTMWLLTRMEAPQISPSSLSKIIQNYRYKRNKETKSIFFVSMFQMKITIFPKSILPLVYFLSLLVSFWAFYSSVLFFKTLKELFFLCSSKMFWYLLKKHCTKLVITYSAICCLLPLTVAYLFFISVFALLGYFSLYHFTIGTFLPLDIISFRVHQSFSML